MSQPKVDQSSGIERSSGIQHAASHEMDVCGLPLECCCFASHFYRRSHDLGRNGFGFEDGVSCAVRQIPFLKDRDKIS